MKSFFRFSPFEIFILLIGLICTVLCALILLSGTTIFTFPDFSEAIAPPVFDAPYVSVNPDVAPQATRPSDVAQSTATPMTTATPLETAATTDAKPQEVPAVTPFPTLAPSKYERIYLIYPASQAIFTHTGVDDKNAYSIKLKFEVDPQNTPCRLEIKKGEEVILAKELDGSPTGLYEVSVQIKSPALYKWQVFTQHTQSGERLFTIRK